MKNILILISICLSFSTNHFAFAQKKEGCDKFTFCKWEKIEKNKGIYSYKNTRIELKHFLDESKNVAGKILTVNNKVIDRITDDSYVQIPYLYTYPKGNISLLFIEEADEGGIWGYIVYLIENDKVYKSGYLEISSVEDSIPFTKNFISCINNIDKIVFKIITMEYFDTSDYVVRKSIYFRYYIDKKTKKITKSNVPLT